MINAQEWLDKNYPKKQRWSIEELDLSNQNLEGDLDLSDFLSLRLININGNPLLGKITDNKEQRTIIKINAQEWLNWKYPQREEVSKIEFDSREQVEGELVIINFPQLEKIDFWRPHDTKKTTSDELRAIFPQKNLNWGFCSDNPITSLEVISCPSLKEIDCSNSPITKLNIQGCYNLESLVCFDNQITSLDLSSCPNLKKLECNDNFLNNLDLSQNQKLEELNILNNNFSEQDLSFLSYLINLKKLYLGSSWDHTKQRQEHSLYNHFYGSLEPLKNLSKLKELSLDNTNINSGVEYLPGEVIVSHSSEVIPQSKVKEISLQLDLFNSKNQKSWEEVGFALEEIKKWMKLGLATSDWDFAIYLKNQKNLSVSEIAPEEVSLNGKLRKKYNKMSWKDIHPNFTPELRQKWLEKGFSYEQVQKWVKDKNLFTMEIHPELKPEESGLAEYLQEKGITPQETYYYLDKLRKEYEELEKKNLDSLNYETEAFEAGNWRDIHPHFGEQFQSCWESLGFDYQQTRKLINKGLEPYEFGFAYYLKIVELESQIFQLLTSDLIKLNLLAEQQQDI